MSRETKDQPGSGKAILLGLLVVVATGAAIHLLGGDDSAEEPEQQTVEDEVLVITPGMPSGRIASASWHTDDASKQASASEGEEEEDDEDGESTSLFDRVDWDGGDDKDKKFERSLEETVSEIHGLGIYVDKNSDADGEEEKGQPRKKR